MWYAIEGHDTEGALPRRMAARPAHLARLTALRDEGRLLLAGPCPAIDAEDPGEAGFSGSIVIAEFGFYWAHRLCHEIRLRPGRRAPVPQGAAETVERVARIRQALEQAFQPSHLEVIDDSHRHAGHAGLIVGEPDVVRAELAGEVVVEYLGDARRVARRREARGDGQGE